MTDRRGVDERDLNQLRYSPQACQKRAERNHRKELEKQRIEKKNSEARKDYLAILEILNKPRASPFK